MNDLLGRIDAATTYIHTQTDLQPAVGLILDRKRLYTRTAVRGRMGWLGGRVERLGVTRVQRNSE